MSKAIKRSVVLITVVAAFAAISAPMAQARFDLNPPTASNSQVPAEYQAQTGIPTTPRGGAARAIVAGAAQPAAPVAEGTGSSSGGFDWGDAAIGASAMLVLMVLGTGAVLVTRGRRQAALAQSS